MRQRSDQHTNLRTLLRAGLRTGVADGLFASALSVFAYGSTVMRLWQGVAATVLGRSALDGGLATAAAGLLMHFAVAFWWSAVFLFVVMRSSSVRSVLASRYGPIRIASLYGPCVWMVMSLAVIPALAGRPPAMSVRWWVQFFGHIPFVALPIVASARQRLLVPPHL